MLRYCANNGNAHGHANSHLNSPSSHKAIFSLARITRGSINSHHVVRCNLKMAIKYYYGKKTEFIGKTLFEILANLRNFGVGRMVIKQTEVAQNPGKKCYYIVRKVEPVMDKELKEGAIHAERVFRNARIPGLSYVENDSWFTDWQLVPKDQEHNYRDHELIEYRLENVYNQMRIPPLMEEFLRRHNKFHPDRFKTETLTQLE